MRGGCKSFVAINKSFDLAIVGKEEDSLKFSENGWGRRSSLLLPKHVAFWLLRAWSKFCKSMSSNWYNQMRRDSSIFLLESKRNPVSKFPQLSIIKAGRRSFIIFPAGWNERGWARILDALNEIVGPSNLGVGDSHKLSSPQQPLANGIMPSPSPPPPHPGCCPKCSFTREPACFLRSYAHVVQATP